MSKYYKYSSTHPTINQSEYAIEMKKILNRIKPSYNRKKDMKEIGKKVISNDLVMNWFYHWFVQDGRRWTEEDVSDSIGPQLYDWKDNNNILDDKDYEDFNYDSDLSKIIINALKKYRPKSLGKTIKWNNLELPVIWLKRNIDNIISGRTPDINEIKENIEKIIDFYKKNLR